MASSPLVNTQNIKVHKSKEKERVSAFRYFDKDADGVINEESLLELLGAMGQYPTKIELRRIRFCLNTKAVTQRDFLNLTNSSVIDPYVNRPKEILMDMFKLYNAARNGRESSTPTKGVIKVNDDFLIRRADWVKFTTDVIWPVTEKKKERYLAKMEPFILCTIPSVLPDECYEGTKIDYKAWLDTLIFADDSVRLAHPKTDITRAFKLFQIMFRRMNYENKDGEYIVEDRERVAESDLEFYSSVFLADLTDAEKDAFMSDFRQYSDDEGNISYEYFQRKFLNI